MRVLLITTMRNEAPFILEWIAYHRHIGVTDFLVYSNDCDDGTDVLLDRLHALGIITHERNHSGGKKTVQWRALTKAQRHPLVAAADWIYVADVDEFLNVHVGDGRISDLMAAVPDAQGFSIPWRMFGNAGIVGFEDVPMTTQFTKAAPEAMLWPWRAVLYKSLFQTGHAVEKLGVHRPKLVADADDGLWVDGNGAPLPDHPGVFHRTTSPRYGLAQINHYALGSIESFLIKAARGKPNHTHDPIDITYWIDRNFCDVADTRILRHGDAIAVGVDALKADPTVAALHQAGVAWRKTQITAKLDTLEGFNLAARLQQMPPTRVLDMPVQVKMLRGIAQVRERLDAQED